ncbi:MAG: phosphogluconate dehydratase [Candidatus Puniceispirillaceae bacterium]
MALHPIVEQVTEAIRHRSQKTRQAYLSALHDMANDSDQDRKKIGCSNLAHAGAGAGQDQDDVTGLSGNDKPNIAIISAYNDMLSAHQPFETYPSVIRAAARQAGATAQMAGGVPAMCDGVTQGRPGMELSLASRDVIAMSTAVGLSHGVYDGALCLGVCDKIIPGLVMGALSFGHLPTIFVPAGPMPSGLPNDEKAAIRKAYAKGEVGRDALLKAEMAAYHSAGTCTFYGTANSNQMLMEIMGLHLPGGTFVNPHEDLRHALTVAATEQVIAISRKSNDVRPLGEVLDERSFVNAVIGLHATGGSTNHTLHLPAMAAAAGIILTWDDFDALSQITPLLARLYPNGSADVNHFNAAGGMGFVIHQLLEAGLLHGDARTIWGDGLSDYVSEPVLQDHGLSWREGPKTSLDDAVLRAVDTPHAVNGGLKMLQGNLGRAVMKISAVAPERHNITAPAAVFETEAEVKAAFAEGLLDRDVIVVVRGQGPAATGMPELHSLTPLLSILQDKGFVVGLVTDGRMSGASGKVPSAIHITPEAAKAGPICQLQDGDMVTINAIDGAISTTADLANRTAKTDYDAMTAAGFGRGLFASYRQEVVSAEEGGGLKLVSLS